MKPFSSLVDATGTRLGASAGRRQFLAAGSILGREGRRRVAGLTLVEVMVAATLFTLMAIGILASMVQTRKLSENSAAQGIAATIAQGIIEQVQLVNYTDLTTSPVLPLKFTAETGANVASIQQTNLPWAADAVTYTPIGAVVDPNVVGSPVLGVLLDFNYQNGSTIVRAARYMNMSVNLQRVPNPANDNVKIVLSYRWQPPTSSGSPTPATITREIRTVRSQVPSY